MIEDPIVEKIHRIRRQMLREEAQDPGLREREHREIQAAFPSGVITPEEFFAWARKKRKERAAAETPPASAKPPKSRPPRSAGSNKAGAKARG